MDFDRLYMILARVLVLFTAMPVHECAHGFMANRLGDDSAKRAGRLTLNPFKHLDLLGSLLILFTGFGWAKPVMVDPRNFKKPKRDMALTALAGPVSNLLMSLAAITLYKLFMGILPALRYMTSWGAFFYMIQLILLTVLVTNIRLAVFNLLPVPPLDGSKIFGAILPERLYFFFMQYERYVALLLMVMIFSGILSTPLGYLVDWVLWLLDAITMPLGRF